MTAYCGHGARPLPPIPLSVPASEGSMPVFAALAQRKTTRKISATPLPLPVLSNLLWAAFGINRKLGPFGLSGRTAASASNSQEIDLYVALEEGVYVYDVDTGLIAGNVYLFAAAQGLAAWFHNCNKAALAAELKLRPEQRVLYAQTVGYPAKG